MFANEFKTADIFADNMVLQRQKSLPVWGWAKPGMKISVEFKGQKLNTVVDENGRWQVRLKPVEADSKGSAMTISWPGGNRVIKDILVGEVWICSGQSNMERPVSRSKRGVEMITKAGNSQIRLMQVPRKTSGFPVRAFESKWRLCDSESVKNFSAVGYYFGLELFKNMNIPIGLIESAWGGTRIVPWTPRIGLAMVKQTRYFTDKIATANKEYRADLKKYMPYMKKWLMQAEKDIAAGEEPAFPLKKLPAHQFNSHTAPAGLFNGMIAPLVPFAIRGVIWYQGESNTYENMLYFYKMRALISGWRKAWGEGDFPFYFVQLPPYNYSARSLPAFWEAQYQAAEEIKNCDLVFPGDVGNIRDIHPRRKFPVGKRLAMLALTNEYGKKIIDGKSPVFKSLKVEDGKLVISFKNLETGLKTSNGKAPAEFSVAGKTSKYYPAKAVIKGKTIVLNSTKVKDPVSAKYAWHNLAVPNLCNQKGLPVLPFNTEKKKENVALHKTYVTSDRDPDWDTGLTNSSWGTYRSSCFATAATAHFPKYVTVDLEETEKISEVKLGVPPFGSTRTVEIETSTDGNNFKKVGSAVFEQRKTKIKSVKFPPVKASYLRLKFPDHHVAKVAYNPNIIFITELEAY